MLLAIRPGPFRVLLLEGLLEHPTECLMHVAHLVGLACAARGILPPCSVCGGAYIDGERHGAHPTAHWLCIERQKRGLPTPALRTRCACQPCVEADESLRRSHRDN